MKRPNKVSAQFGRLRIRMIRPVLILVLSLTVPVFAPAQSDPLSPSYMPTIDTNPAHYPSNIWITDTMEKVRKDIGSPGAQHWGTFYGAQNEFVDFQVHVQAGTGGIPSLSVTTSDFVDSRMGTHISASSTDIIVYREAYIDVTQKTATGASYYNSTGFYPDILIPTVDPYHHQTTNAWPFTVTASQNQSAWIDVHLPSAAPSGYYLGSITIKSGSTTLATMPVIIAVWQWPSAGYMPSTSSLQSQGAMGYADACIQFFGGYSGCGSYPGAGGNADTGVTLSLVDDDVIMLDHRYSNANVISPSYTTVFTGLETYYGPLLNVAATNARTILPGARLTTANYGGPGMQNLSYIQHWITEFQAKGWLPTLFDYSVDEPGNSPSLWAQARSQATTLHAASPPMPALITTNIANATANGALNSADWMVPIINDMDPNPGSLQRSSYNAWLAGNCCGTGSSPTRKLWSYQSCESAGTCTNGVTGGSYASYPNEDIDGYAAANRVMEWLTFFHQQSGELYFMTTYAWEGTNNPWTDVYFFGENGAGTWVYPSRSNGINYVTAPGGGALTYPIFLPSVRLKHIRDGMQDYEYLNALNNAGQGSLVAAQIKSWITNSYTFETTGAGLQAARMALGNALHQMSYPVLVSPPTRLRATVQ